MMASGSAGISSSDDGHLDFAHNHSKTSSRPKGAVTTTNKPQHNISSSDDGHLDFMPKSRPLPQAPFVASAAAGATGKSSSSTANVGNMMTSNNANNSSFRPRVNSTSLNYDQEQNEVLNTSSMSGAGEPSRPLQRGAVGTSTGMIGGPPPQQVDRLPPNHVPVSSSSEQFVRKTLAEQVEKELKQTLEEVNDLRHQLNKLHETIESKGEELMSKNRQNSILESRNRALEAEFFELKETQKKQILILKEEIERLRSQLQKKENTNEEVYLSKLEQLQLEKETILDRYERDKNKFDSEQKKLLLEVEYFKQMWKNSEENNEKQLHAFDEVSKQCSLNAKKAKHFEEQCILIERKIYEKNEELSTTKEFVKELQELVRKLQEELKNAVNKGEKLAMEAIQREDKIAKLNVSLRETELKLAREIDLERELQKLHELHSNTKLDKDKLAHKSLILNEDCERQSLRIEKLEKENQLSEEAFQKEKQERLVLEDQLAHVRRELVTLHDANEKLLEMKEEKAAVEDRLADMRRRQVRDSEEMENMKKQVENAEKQRQEVKIDYGRCAEEKRQLMQEVDAKTKWISEARQKLVEFEVTDRSNSMQKAEIQRLQQELSTRENEVSLLQRQIAQDAGMLDRTQRLLQRSEQENSAWRNEDVYLRKMRNNLERNHLAFEQQSALVPTSAPTISINRIPAPDPHQRAAEPATTSINSHRIVPVLPNSSSKTSTGTIPVGSSSRTFAPYKVVPTPSPSSRRALEAEEAVERSSLAELREQQRKTSQLLRYLS
ncbi:unnamed protein product [Amoebophrya sp. A120]|nr:unnamed protein product [Amoebophrya sp. A120]|eukprot:GSA120T00004484001.1